MGREIELLRLGTGLLNKDVTTVALNSLLWSKIYGRCQTEGRAEVVGHLTITDTAPCFPCPETFQTNG